MTLIDLGSLALDYELRGEGPPLLMINGFRRSRVVWLEPLLSALESRFRLVLFDNRGTGHSDKPAEDYAMEAFADDCAGLLEALGMPRAHVFGTSMGGMIAQRLATRHPARVMGLALGCTNWGKGSVNPERRIGQLLRLTPGAEMDAREVARLQEEAYVTDAFRAANRPLLDGLFDLVNANPTPLHAVKGHLKAIDAFDGEAALEAVRCPTLVITGTEDRLIPAENSRRLAARIAGAELCLLPEAAHFFWIEKPRETARALGDFLGRLE
jgi:pimeloyl-ACP methyl ester carboxylesterase